MRSFVPFREVAAKSRIPAAVQLGTEWFAALRRLGAIARPNGEEGAGGRAHDCRYCSNKDDHRTHHVLCACVDKNHLPPAFSALLSISITCGKLTGSSQS